MPKTRRAGRKFQLRRLMQTHFRELTNRSVESDNTTDNINNPSVSAQEQPNEKESFLYKLIPITVEESLLLNTDIPENDPRREYIKTQIENVSVSSK